MVPALPAPLVPTKVVPDELEPSVPLVAEPVLTVEPPVPVTLAPLGAALKSPSDLDESPQLITAKPRATTKNDAERIPNPPTPPGTILECDPEVDRSAM
jgi:hypothetical protein